MKAWIKATGEIAEFSTGKNLQGETILLKVGTASIFSLNEVETIADIDWQHYRIKAAIAAMQGMIVSDAYANTEIANSYTGEKKRVKWDENKIAKAAVAHADALIVELKKGGNDE